VEKEEEIVPHIVTKPSRALAEAVIKARSSKNLSRDQLARVINFIFENSLTQDNFLFFSYSLLMRRFPLLRVSRMRRSFLAD
jgi:hypothetical protein